MKQPNNVDLKAQNFVAPLSTPNVDVRTPKLVKILKHFAKMVAKASTSPPMFEVRRIMLAERRIMLDVADW